MLLLLSVANEVLAVSTEHLELYPCYICIIEMNVVTLCYVTHLTC